MQEYLKSHWNGQLPLWKSFWLSVVTATLLFAFLAAAFYSLSTVVGMLFTALAIPAWIWSHVGLWRCVEQRPGYWRSSQSCTVAPTASWPSTTLLPSF